MSSSTEMNLKLPQPAPFEPNHKTPIQSNNETYPTPASSSGLPVATALLYQDDEVNIWENRLLKHMDGPLHTHDYDYWLAFAKGLTKKTTGPIVYVKQGFTEVASNKKGNVGILFYLVELKNTNNKNNMNKKIIPEPLPKGWGASSAVLYENTEVKIWDQRVPPGLSGKVAIDKASQQVFHMDVRGTRDGTMSLEELYKIEAVSPEQHASRNLGNPRHKGTTYYSTGKDVETAGHALNVGKDELRCILIECKKAPSKL